MEPSQILPMSLEGQCQNETETEEQCHVMAQEDIGVMLTSAKEHQVLMSSSRG